MKVVNIDDEAQYDRLIELTCAKLEELLGPVKVIHVSIDLGRSVPKANDLPVLFNEREELVTSRDQIPRHIGNNDLIWRADLEPFIKEPDCYYVLDIHFSDYLPDYGLQIARYLKMQGVSKYRILLLSNYPTRAYQKVAKQVNVPWGFIFEKEHFPVRNTDEEKQSADKLATLILTLCGNEMLNDRPSSTEGIVGTSEALKRAISLCASVAPSTTTILLSGDSGTGKELLANFIHYNSGREAGPYIKVNCGALPETLLESELFGHERGSFTGAYARQRGKFEEADGGTLFLDEIGEMSLSAQVKLLRVLQDGGFTRLGGSAVLRPDVRVIVATNVDLERAVEDGGFRRDLFYRLTFKIDLPALCERPEDINLLASHFLLKYTRKHDKRIDGFTEEVLHRFKEYTWPGNVRELENVVERAVVLEKGDLIALDVLPSQLLEPNFKQRQEPGSPLLTITWEEQESIVKGDKKQFSAAFKDWVRQIGAGNRRAEKIVWDTLTLAVRMMCNSRDLVRNGTEYHSVRIIIALLDSIIDLGMAEEHRLTPDMLAALCAASGAEIVIDNLSFFKINDKVAGLGNSAQQRWSSSDKRLLLSFIERMVAKNIAENASRVSAGGVRTSDHL
jgi:DNA-binding NtrC family response regulator